MEGGTRRLLGTRAVEFGLAAAGPVSLDALVGWEIARPTELWGWLNDARDRGWVGEAEAEGHFLIADVQRQAAVLAQAGEGDWAWLASKPDLVPAILANARRASAERRHDVALPLFRSLVAIRPDGFPGGLECWTGLVVEFVRRFRMGAALDDQHLERALSAAVASGRLDWQAVLWGARGFAEMRAGRFDRSDPSLERALETAQALDNPAVSFEVHLNVAFNQVLAGQARQAIATFERFLGDLPQEILPLPPELMPPLDPIPETALAILGTNYAQVGEYGRALDLLHRLRNAGVRAGRSYLVALAETFLSGVHAGRREYEPARQNAESAVQYWRTDPTGPYFLWHASISLAWARMTEGRLSDACDVLEEGQRARLASGIMFFGGSALLEVLDCLDVQGVPAPSGLDVDREIGRLLSRPDGYMHAVAHRFRARRLARGVLDEATVAAIGNHHDEGVRLLRESQAGASELARALADAALWAQRQGRHAEAARLDAESRRVFASVDLAPSSVGAIDLATALLDLGRLDARREQGDSMWGGIVARLCGKLGAERCAIFERGGEGLAAVAARGGGPSWVAALRALVEQRQPDEPETLEPPALDGDGVSGELLLVPFRSSRLARRGWAVLENRYSRALVSGAERRVLDVLGVQLGILAENVAMWSELLDARRRLEHENRYFRQDLPTPSNGSRIVGESPALRRALELVARVAPTMTAVMIQGETGVGKELIAREVHRLSQRSRGPFIAVHIASFAQGLVASSLFGHERGAFTGAVEQVRGRFELADGGTLFLDEVGELTMEDQVRLLRVLQEGTFERVGGTRQLRSDFRLVTATNRDLKAAAAKGSFREDLYFRLSAFPIVVPPLRERREEIPTLALYFMERANRTLARGFEGISEADMERLLSYSWPGNVRELEHLVERAAILSEPPRLRIPPLQDVLDPGGPAGSVAPGTLEDAERDYFRRVIERAGGRVAGASGGAAMAGLKASTFNWHVEKLGLRAELERARAGRPRTGQPASSS